MATKKVVSNELFVPMSIEEMKAAIAADNAAAAEVVVTGQALPIVNNGSSPVVLVGGSSPVVKDFTLPSDLEDIFASPEAQTETHEKVSVPVKFSIVGNKFKALNLYFSQNEAGINGMRVVLGIIKLLGLKYTPVTKTTVSTWKEGVETVSPCKPYKFLKLSPSANGMSCPKLLVKLAASIEANGVEWA